MVAAGDRLDNPWDYDPNRRGIKTGDVLDNPGGVGPSRYDPGSGGGYGAPPNAGFGVPDAPGRTIRRLKLGRLAAPDKFTFRDFQAPDANSVLSDPGYQFRLKQGQQSLQNSAAVSGLLRTGGTLKDLLNYGQEAASQEYGNAYDRAFNEWGSARSAAADAYDRNWQAQQATYGANTAADLGEWNADFQAGDAEYDPQYQTWLARNRSNELGFDRGWQQYLYQNDDQYRRGRDSSNDAFRNRQFEEDVRRFGLDDAWRRYQLEENRRIELARLGR